MRTPGKMTACAIVLLLGAAPCAAQAMSPGAARIFGLDGITVVYPASPAEARESSRHSAERRAAFLREVHGLDAGAARDDQLTDEQRRGHLLAIGWANGLVREGPHPVVRPLEDGYLFLDSLPVLDGRDLLFAWTSPFSPNRVLAFWSRIDPEIDRFSVLPFNGSDWAIYDGLVVVRQGMFAAGAWPPRREHEAERAYPERTRPLGERETSEHFTLRHTATIPPAEAQEILAARERALATAAETVGPIPAGFQIDVHVYDDADLKRDLSGCDDPIHVWPSRRELHTLRRYATWSTPRHEAQILAAARFGAPSLTAFHEGIAVLAEPASPERSLPLYAALLLERDWVPEIDELLDEERLRRLARSGLGYPACGLLVRWLRETADEATFARVFRQPEADLEVLADMLGASPKRLRRSFERWVARLADEGRPDLRFAEALSEAQARRDAGDPAAAEAALQRALELRPSDLETLYRLVVVRVEAGRFAEARESAETLLAQPLAGGEARLAALTRYQLAKALDGLGEREAAVEQFRKVLELPDERGLHRLAREAIEAPTSGGD